MICCDEKKRKKKRRDLQLYTALFCNQEPEAITLRVKYTHTYIYICKDVRKITIIRTTTKKEETKEQANGMLRCVVKPED